MKTQDMLWYFFAIWWQITPGYAIVPQATSLKYCKILINEWNFAPSGNAYENQFVELRSFCNEDPKQVSTVDMKRYKLLYINPMGELLGVCFTQQRKKFNSKTEWFFVYGGEDVQDPDMSLKNCEISSFLRTTRNMYFPTGTTHPFALILLYNQRMDTDTTFVMAKEGNAVRHRQLTKSELEKLRNNMQDMYVFGSRTEISSCELFEFLLQPYGVTRVRVLRDWQVDPRGIDKSINRCGPGVEPFSVASMKHSSPTPGKQNECDPAFPFFIEDHLPPLQPPRRIQLANTGDFRFCTVETNDEANANLRITNPEIFERQMEIAEQQNVREEPMEIEIQQDDTCTNAATTGGFDIDTSGINNPNADSFVWEDCKPFPRDWITAIENDPAQPLDTKHILKHDTCFWWEYMPLIKTGRCKLCLALIKQGIIFDRPQKITRMMTEDGYMYRTANKNARTINKDAIESHKQHPLHKIAVQYFENIDRNLTGLELEKAMMTKGMPYRNFFQSTENLLVTVYQAVRMGLSFRKFKILTDTLKYLGVSLGHVHSQEDGMKLILMHIEKMMRQDLMNYLRKEKPQLSVTLDTSSDIGGVSSLAVIFQTFVRNTPKTFFYRLIPTTGETGAQIFETFRRSLVEDNIESYVKDHLTGYIADGCSTMVSTFQEELRKFVNSGYIHVWCYAHKLECAAKSALKEFGIVKDLQQNINDLASFYGARSPKKKRVLYEVTQDHGFPKFELHRIQAIRWVASKKRAMETISQRWKVIVEATEKIANDQSFRAETRKAARTTLGYLKNRTFIATLSFLNDITAYLTEVSVSLQRRGGTVIGKRKLIIGLKNQLGQLKHSYGTTISEIVANSEIPGRDRSGVSLVEFETAAGLKYRGIELGATEEELSNSTLCVNYFPMVDSMLEKIDNYFSFKDLHDNFEIFDPSQMYEHRADTSYGQQSLLKMNEYYKWGHDSEVLKRDWNSLREKVVNYEKFEECVLKTPEEFWSAMLDEDDETLGWTEITRDVIRRILTITATSSEAERVFSLFSAEKTRTRFNLKTETVNALVAIKFNGVDNLKNFDSFRYTKEFVRAHSRADDSSRRPPKQADAKEDFFLTIFD